MNQVFPSSSRPPRPSPAGSVRKEHVEDADSTSARGVVSDDDDDNGDQSSRKPYSKRRQALLSREAQARRESVCLMKSMGSLQLIKDEWDDENSARETYDLPPPPDLPSESEEENDSDWDSEWEAMPRPSVLNRHIGWQSLRRLVSESPATVDESLSPDEESGVANVSASPAAGETDRLLQRQDSKYSTLSRT